MTKRGFTLVELLAVIVIIGLLFAIAIPNVNNVINSSKEKLYDSVVEEIKKAAKMYTIKYDSEIEGLDSNGYGYITMEELSNKGILDSIVINPKTNKAFASSAVKVKKISDGKYEFEFLLDGIPN